MAKIFSECAARKIKFGAVKEMGRFVTSDNFRQSCHSSIIVGSYFPSLLVSSVGTRKATGLWSAACSSSRTVAITVFPEPSVYNLMKHGTLSLIAQPRSTL